MKDQKKNIIIKMSTLKYSEILLKYSKIIEITIKEIIVRFIKIHFLKKFLDYIAPKVIENIK